MKSRAQHIIVDAACIVLLAVAPAVQVCSAGTFYVRHGGAGVANGSDWANAYSSLQQALNAAPYGVANVVYVQASTGAQYYGTCAITANGSLNVNFQGGWENVDLAPTQTAVSVVRSAATNQPGFSTTSGAISCPVTLTLNRFSISNVTRGVYMYAAWDKDYCGQVLTISNSTIRAQSDGLRLEYPKNYAWDVYGGLCRVTAINIDIVAGLGGAGYGIYSQGAWHGSSVTGRGVDPVTGGKLASSITTSNGWGVYFMTSHNDSRAYTATFSNLVVYGCSTNAIGLNPTAYVWYDGYAVPPGLKTNAPPVSVALRNCTVADNRGHGVYSVAWEASSISVTNCIFATNSCSGLRLDSQGHGAVFSLSEDYNIFFADDIYRNSGTASFGANDKTNSPLFYGRRAQPDPWYRISSRESSAFRNGTDGKHRGAYDIEKFVAGLVISIW